MRCAGKKFDGMVPDRMAWEPLGLLFTKDLHVTSIMSGDFLVVGGLFWGMQCDSAYEVSVISDGSGSVNASGKEFCPFCIWASEYNGEMGVVNPSSFPIYLGLYGREPRVAEDGFVFA